MERLFWSWAWVIALILASAILFEWGQRTNKEEENRLRERLNHLLLSKELAEKEQNALRQQIESHNDPKWIELVLIERLGLVPEGYKKVVFLPKE